MKKKFRLMLHNVREFFGLIAQIMLLGYENTPNTVSYKLAVGSVKNWAAAATIFMMAIVSFSFVGKGALYIILAAGARCFSHLATPTELLPGILFDLFYGAQETLASTSYFVGWLSNTPDMVQITVGVLAFVVLFKVVFLTISYFISAIKWDCKLIFSLINHRTNSN